MENAQTTALPIGRFYNSIRGTRFWHFAGVPATEVNTDPENGPIKYGPRRRNAGLMYDVDVPGDPRVAYREYNLTSQDPGDPLSPVVIWRREQMHDGLSVEQVDRVSHDPERTYRALWRLAIWATGQPAVATWRDCTYI